MYKIVIGLEVHVELNTKSKIFSPSINSYDKNINTNITEIDFAFPGVLPTLNKEAVHKAISLAVALNAKISPYILFDRKNYYYPDLPKGFQITQMTKPLGTSGYLELTEAGKTRKVLIHQIHLEEDSASLDHTNDYSIINYNRVGVPLIEIVTEPCMNSVEEAINFLESLRSIIKYLGISDADQSKGQIRCDVNVSLMKSTDTTLGTRVEVKNINSFNSVKETLGYEIKRQSDLLDRGEKIKRETRRFSFLDKKTYSMREKAEEADYRYYVEPNIPKIDIEPSLIKLIKENIPLLPEERKIKYINEYGLSETDAKTITKEKTISDLFEGVVSLGSNPKEASNWITGKLIAYLNKFGIESLELSAENLHELICLLDNKTISSQQAKEVFDIMLDKNKSPKEIVESLGMSQIMDEKVIYSIVNEVLDNNANAIKTFKSGKTNIIGFLVGMVLKASNGKINPKLASEMLEQEINKR